MCMATKIEEINTRVSALESAKGVGKTEAPPDYAQLQVKLDQMCVLLFGSSDLPAVRDKSGVVVK